MDAEGLDVQGLRAFDLRTFKPNGEVWDFTKSSDQKQARQYVLKMRNLLGSLAVRLALSFLVGIKD